MQTLWGRTWRFPLALTIIVLLALVLRLYQLGDIPTGLHEDEMMNGYVGRFILQNGVDLYGNRWPLLYFDNFGDFPPVIPMYLSGLATFLFGLTPFAIRFPIALAGALAVLPLYFLLKQIFASPHAALAGSFFLAVLPWHILLSRSTAENVTAGTVYLISLVILGSVIRKENRRFIVPYALLQGGLYFLYATFRVTTPLTLLATMFFVKEKKTRLLLLGLAICFGCLTLAIGKTPWGQGRFKQTSIFYFNQTLEGRMKKFAIEEGPDQVFITRAFHNKAVVYAREFIRQYLSYFSPNFLFTDGGLPHRYLESDTGLLPLGFLGFAVVALFLSLFDTSGPTHSLWTPGGKRLFTYLLVVLLLSPIPAALTLDDVPNVHRAALIGILSVVPATYLFMRLHSLHWRKISAQGIGILIILVELVYFMHQLFVHVPHTQSTFRGDDRTTLAAYVRAHHQEYDVVYLPQDAKPLYYLFFTQDFRPSLAGRFGPNITLPQVDNLVFTGPNCPSLSKEIVPTTRSLVIDRGECDYPSGYEVIHRVMRRDGSASFRVQKKIITPKLQ